MLAQEAWEVVRLPALAEEDEDQLVDTVLGAAAWFGRYRPDELPARFERIVQSWDTAEQL